MKKPLLGLLSVLNFCALAQTKKAALIGLSTHKIDVTYIGKQPPVQNPPTCFVPNGSMYTDSITYVLLRTKVDSILPLMGFTRLPDDSILKTTTYNELARKIREPYRHGSTTQEIPAKGFSYIPWNGLGKLNYSKEFFEIPSNPDLIVVAYVDFDINNSNGKGGVNTVNVACEAFIKAFNKKNKKVFKLRARFTSPHALSTQFGSNSCWGLDITEDISSYQKEALLGALKKLDEELIEELADMKKESEKK